MWLSRAYPQSLFAIASNSKLFTYMAIGLLIENKTELAGGECFGWNTKVKDVVPGWRMQDDYARDHVDITDLLGTCGLAASLGGKLTTSASLWDASA